MFDKHQKVVVTGGRYYKNKENVFQVLDELQPRHVVHGHCEIDGELWGADRWADEWARQNGITLSVYPVYSEQWSILGKSAGPNRNKTMLQDSQPDLVVAFPGGRGTANCVKTARAMGIEVREISC